MTRIKPVFTRLGVASTAIAFLVTALPASAQDTQQAPQTGAGDPCVVQPEMQGEQGQSGSTQNGSADSGNATAQLDRCNGVLRPPPVADPEIVEPPPATGETPVIPPSALPEQQPPAQ